MASIRLASQRPRRLAARRPSRVLEIAAGTGVVTRALATVLASSVDIVATDLNQPMLDRASSVGTSRPIEWRQADAMALPFGDGRSTTEAVQKLDCGLFSGVSRPLPTLDQSCAARSTRASLPAPRFARTAWVHLLSSADAPLTPGTGP